MNEHESGTIEKFVLSFVCGFCGESLTVEHRMFAFWNDEYHDCFGERVGMVAAVADNGPIDACEGIEIERETLHE